MSVWPLVLVCTVTTGHASIVVMAIPHVKRKREENHRESKPPEPTGLKPVRLDYIRRQITISNVVKIGP